MKKYLIFFCMILLSQFAAGCAAEPQIMHKTALFLGSKTPFGKLGKVYAKIEHDVNHSEEFANWSPTEKAAYKCSSGTCLGGCAVTSGYLCGGPACAVVTSVCFASGVYYEKYKRSTILVNDY